MDDKVEKAHRKAHPGVVRIYHVGSDSFRDAKQADVDRMAKELARLRAMEIEMKKLLCKFDERVY